MNSQYRVVVIGGGVVGASVLYLAAGSVLTPWLWADPLGVFVKVLPAIGLALLLAAMAEER